MPAKPKLIGPGGQLYAEIHPSSDETSFRVNNTSAAYYNSPYYLVHKSQVQPIPAPRTGVPLQLKLDDFVGPQMIAAIQSAGKIVFHAVGDTGAAKVDHQQTVARALANQAHVADTMVGDLAGPNPPAFFFHLGDIIYHFGEAQYITTSFMNRTGCTIGPFSPFRETTTGWFSGPLQVPRKTPRCRLSWTISAPRRSGHRPTPEG